MTKSLEETASLEARGKRLRSIRDALRLTRKEFSSRYQVPVGSLQNWEDARYGGLSEKGAKKLIKLLEPDGIKCTLEWLFYGVGEGPVLPATWLNIAMESIVTLPEEASIAQELRVFHQLNSGGIDTLLTDDSMLPFYLPGDVVAGKRYFDQEMVIAIGYRCIVQTESDGMLVRVVNAGTQPGLYTLTCTNSHTTVINPILRNVRLFSVAPILWHRCKSTAPSIDGN